jgi:F-type H+-transporting ATPase subunit gamma
MGAQLRVYKQKISSAQTTKKITKAMELIAASRIQKAMARVRVLALRAGRDAGRLRRGDALERSAPADDRARDDPPIRGRHLRLGPGPGRRVQLADPARGPAARRAAAFAGQGGRVLPRRTQGGGLLPVPPHGVGGEWIGDTDTPHFNTAEQIAGALLDAYDRGGEEQGGVDEIHLVFNRFVSMMTQEPQTVRLLPLEVVEADEVVESAGASSQVYPLYEFEPSPEVVLDALLPVYVQSRVFNALLQSSAAKHAATQKAMKSASDNADKLITDYTRLRNNARQAEITQQIAEIVGGADALASGK